MPLQMMSFHFETCVFICQNGFRGVARTFYLVRPAF